MFGKLFRWGIFGGLNILWLWQHIHLLIMTVAICKEMYRITHHPETNSKSMTIFHNETRTLEKKIQEPRSAWARIRDEVLPLQLIACVETLHWTVDMEYQMYKKKELELDLNTLAITEGMKFAVWYSLNRGEEGKKQQEQAYREAAYQEIWRRGPVQRQTFKNEVPRLASQHDSSARELFSLHDTTVTDFFMLPFLIATGFAALWVSSSVLRKAPKVDQKERDSTSRGSDNA